MKVVLIEPSDGDASSGKPPCRGRGCRWDSFVVWNYRLLGGDDGGAGFGFTWRGNAPRRIKDGCDRNRNAHNEIMLPSQDQTSALGNPSRTRRGVTCAALRFPPTVRAAVVGIETAVASASA
jgi:hypothetical protein